MIYGDEKKYINEISPQNISNDSELNDNLPPKLILSIGSYSKPSLIDLIHDIRSHVIYCTERDVAVDVIFNICIDHLPIEDDFRYINKYIFLIDYLNDLSDQLDSVNFMFNIRGYVTPFLFPIVASNFECTIHSYSILNSMENDLVIDNSDFLMGCNRISRYSAKIGKDDTNGYEYCRKEIESRQKLANLAR